MKQGQAALEFLMTYGWALIMILILIAALAYFGIFNPKKILPSRCTFSPEINCIDYNIAYGTDGTDGSVKLKLKNSIGDSVIIDSIVMSSDSVVKLVCIPPAITTWPNDEIEDFEWSSCNTQSAGFIAGKDGKIQFVFKYHILKSSSDYGRLVQGEVLTTVV